MSFHPFRKILSFHKHMATVELVCLKTYNIQLYIFLNNAYLFALTGFKVFVVFLFDK